MKKSIDTLENLIIITGHYGCGKTNFAINLAMYYRRLGEKVTLVDMDVVNPYFRTSNYQAELEAAGIDVVCPNYAATNLDLPSLPAAMYGVFDLPGRVILDVGGDDVGATVLGRFHEKLKDKTYDMLYLVNYRRNLTPDSEEMTVLLREIERSSRTKATCIVNNSHLKEFTTEDLLVREKIKAEELAEQLGLPLLGTTVPRALYNNDMFTEKAEYLPVDIYVKTIWEKS